MEQQAQMWNTAKKKGFKLKLEPVKTQICSLKPRPFHPKNDAAVDEDPVKDKAMTQWKHLLPYVCCAFRLLRTNGHWPHEAHADNIRAWVQTAWKAVCICEAKWESGLKVLRGVRSNPQHLYKSTPLPWRCWRAAKQFFFKSNEGWRVAGSLSVVSSQLLSVLMNIDISAYLLMDRCCLHAYFVWHTCSKLSSDLSNNSPQHNKMVKKRRDCY